MSSPDAATQAASTPRLGAETLVEALHLALAARALDRHGAIAMLTAEPASATDLAARTGLDAELLAGTLAYLAARTELVEHMPGGFASGGANGAAAQFLIRLYGDAFLPCSAALPVMLGRGSPGRIDEGARGRAFASAPLVATETLAAILHQLGVARLLDLGCGSGGLLATLAAASADFRGWGLDRNPRSCSAARARLRGVGAQARVVIARGDVARPERAISAGWIDQIETLFAGDLINEFMTDDGRPAIAFLSELARLFPGRLLVVADYYGRLGSGHAAPPMTLLHDFVQFASGQGIPPPDLEQWVRLYDEAGWRIVHAIDDPGSERFVHILTTRATFPRR